MRISTEAAQEIATDTRKVIYPEGRVRQIAADLVSERERVAELEAQLAEIKKMYEQEVKWRKAYQEAKGKMYEAGGDIGQLAIDNMPCNEGELDLWFLKSYVSREAYDSLKAELVAQLAEALKDEERWHLWIADYKRDIAGLFDDVAQGWTKAQWDEFVDGKIAAAAAEGKKG